MKAKSTWIAIVAAAAAVACEPEPTGTGSDGIDTVAGTDLANPYLSFEGRETFDYNDGSYPEGSFNCQLSWDLSGTPLNPMDADCDGCVFMFDVHYTLRSGADVYDDGTCTGLMGDTYGTYGYSTDLDGYGAAWVFSYNGTYYWWGYADFDNSSFTYHYGYTDYPAYDYYYTYYQHGVITVQ